MRKIFEFIFLTILAAVSSLILGVLLRIALECPGAILVLFPMYFGVIYGIIMYLAYVWDMLGDLGIGK